MSSLFERFSSRENLKKAYTYVQDELSRSSLSVNPINHPSTTAINDLGEHFFIALEQHIRNGSYKPERGFFVYMPKDNLGLRPVCILSMIDRIVYQAIFNQTILGHKIDGQLSDKVCFANRVDDDEQSERFLSQYFNGWEDFCKKQKKAFDKGYSWKLEVDVQQYYEHIPVNRLIEKLDKDFAIKDESILSILKEQLCTWAEYPELPKGIPQGPEASAILGNVYLSSLDSFVEKELLGKELQYFRYADDITLMGKTKEDILKATEKIVHFLREHNLTLNEKTRLTELEDTETIEAMRFFSDYEDDTPEIPEDDFTRVQNKVPNIVDSIQNGERVEKLEIKELKYFLRNDTTYSVIFMTQLVELILHRPSLTVPIVQYISEGRKTLDDFDKFMVDVNLWDIYKNTSISEWSRFWVFKLLVSNKDVQVDNIGVEIKRILSSKENTIFKIVCFYYQAIHSEKMSIEQINQAVDGSNTDIEKSIYSFFLLNAFQNIRIPVIKSHIERLLNSTSNELNLIGSYLFKNKPKAHIEEFDSVFSDYLLKRKTTKKNSIKKQIDNQKQASNLFLVRGENLIQIDSPSSIFGINRQKRKKHTVELIFPEAVQWNKVILKLKDGLQDIEIWYGKQHIKNTNYVELGFSANKKDHKPDKKWNLLCILSIMQNTDITKATPEALMPMLAKYSNKATKKATVHQTKKLLSNALRSIFNTGDDPFMDNRIYYEPRFKILPESIMRHKEMWKRDGSFNENIKFEEDTDIDIE
jgi:hypothetical protein